MGEHGPCTGICSVFKDADATVLGVLPLVPPKKANLIGDFLVKTLQSRMKQPKSPAKGLHCQDEVHFSPDSESFPGPSPAHPRYWLHLYSAASPRLLPKVSLCLQRSLLIRCTGPSNHSSLTPGDCQLPEVSRPSMFALAISSSNINISMKTNPQTSGLALCVVVNWILENWTQTSASIWI